MPADLLMFQGTASHVGKSVMAAAFCRLLKRRGLRVAPFKAMNMSNNAWVTRDGKEMAMAQAVQAWSAGIEPVVDMNPVLLKTTSDHASQVIVLGKPIGTYEARDLPALRARLLKAIHESLQRMRDSYDVIVAEGAGSPAEINLRATDLANMEVARAAEGRVLLVADIERGGVFAQIVGTLELLEEKDRARVHGFLINKFRGDSSLVDSGVRWLEQRTGKPVLGVIPYFPEMDIPEEDALADRLTAKPGSFEKVRVEIVRYPSIANFTDFDSLHREADLSVRYLSAASSEDRLPHLLILPGSKSTVSDLIWLRNTGLEPYLRRCAAEGVRILGICGGFQMLGQTICDPSHVESTGGVIYGLCLLPTSTLFLPSKVTVQVRGIHPESGAALTGYEIHCGRLQGARRAKPLFQVTERGGQPVKETDGCQSDNGRIWGTYLHGMFDSEEFRHFFLNQLRREAGLPEPNGISARIDPYDRLADRVEKVVDVDRLMEQWAWTPSA
ncbi:MAG: cobyric acid synthase [Candidatus Omnitrophica bacterium]|nr:cobyric acid synthase [Candidatus Omnitrophota bacterium]